MERRRSFDKKTRSEWQLNNSHLNTHFRFVTVKETKLRDRSQSTASRTCTMVHRGHCFALLFFFAYMGKLLLFDVDRHPISETNERFI